MKLAQWQTEDENATWAKGVGRQMFFNSKGWGWGAWGLPPIYLDRWGQSQFS
ncbi:MAG: hypothetical protein Fur0042_14470 [Cyanophyceae cyanobacterium]